MRLFCGWGMISDDTEHAFMVAQSLLDSPEDVGRFPSSSGLPDGWLGFVGLPAGVGLATARACLKTLAGYLAETERRVFRRKRPSYAQRPHRCVFR